MSLVDDESSHEQQPEEEQPEEAGAEQPGLLTRVEGDAEHGHEAEPGDDLAIPDELPILPLRGLVVYPETAVPLMVGQPRSVRLVDDVVGGDRLVGLVASLDPENEEPGPDEIHNIGTAAAVHRLFRAPDGTIRLLVQGLARIRVDEYTVTEPYLKARISRVPETVESGIEVEALMRNIGEQFRRLSELVPSIPNELLATALSIEDPLQLVYTIATYMRIDLDDAQEIITLDSTVEKLRSALRRVWLRGQSQARSMWAWPEAKSCTGSGGPLCSTAWRNSFSASGTLA